MASHVERNKEKIVGSCCICGEEKELTFEHLPSKASGNVRRVKHSRPTDIFVDNTTNLYAPAFTILQQGIGGPSLCKNCNNSTGRWYGAAYSEFALCVARALEKKNDAVSVDLSHTIYPLRVIKQVVSIFLSANDAGFHSVKPELKEFVLDRDARSLPDGIHIYMYATISERSRLCPFGVSIKAMTNEPRKFFSEVASAPLGFVMTMDSEPPCDDLYDMTHFVQFDYNQQEDFSSRLPVKSIYSYFAGDYRTIEQIEFDFLLGKIRGNYLKLEGPNSPKPPALQFHIPFLDSGRIAGLFCPHEPREQSNADNGTERLHKHDFDKYDCILIICSATEEVSNEQLTVSHVSNLTVNSEPISFCFRGISAESARRHGCRKLVEYVARIFDDQNVTGRVAIISDIDGETQKKVNNGQVPLSAEFALPQNFELVSPTNAIEMEVFDKLKLECLEQASNILNEFRSVGLPQMINGQFRFRTIQDLPIVGSEASLEDRNTSTTGTS